MAISQNELADKLGVSKMTIFRALRNEKGVSEKTRMRILNAARRAGLPLPPSSRKRASHELKHVICSSAPEPSSETAYHLRLLSGLKRGANECSAELVNWPIQSDQWPLIVNRKQVDGIILVWGDEHNPMPHSNSPVPSIFIHHSPPQADVVDVDNFAGGLLLGKHLAEMGHRRIAFIGPDSMVSLKRLAGLRTALAEKGGECPGEFTVAVRAKLEMGKQLTDRLLEQVGWKPGAGKLPFTALMAYNDFVAAHVFTRLQQLGLRVPGDLSMVGFDAVSPKWYNGPKLTTCEVPLEEIGAEASRLVYWRIEHPNAIRRKLLLDVELVRGESVVRV